MLEKDDEEVEGQIIRTWGFELLHRWEGIRISFSAAMAERASLY